MLEKVCDTGVVGAAEDLYGVDSVLVYGMTRTDYRAVPVGHELRVCY
jgi:hypothetical protein